MRGAPRSSQWPAVQVALVCIAITPCVSVAASNPLRFGIAASNELARMRAMLVEMNEQRIDPADALQWIHANDPVAA